MSLDLARNAGGDQASNVGANPIGPTYSSRPVDNRRAWPMIWLRLLSPVVDA